MLEVPFETGAKVTLGRMRRHHEDSDVHISSYKLLLPHRFEKARGGADAAPPRLVASSWRGWRSPHPHPVGTIVAQPRSDNRAARPLPRKNAGEVSHRSYAVTLCRFGLRAVELLQLRHHFLRE